MASYLQIENLTKSYGDRMLFDSVTFGVNEGDKIGIIAKNGTGKTTMLRIVAGKESCDSGSVTFRSGLHVGMLEQIPYLRPGATVLEACLSNHKGIPQAIKQYEAAVRSGDDRLLSQALAEMDAVQGWDYEDRLRQMLTSLHITDMDACVDTLSGGQRKRVALAQLLLDSPDMLILDEPTNHLDISIIEWLEDYLTRQRITLLMVTHDRYFLDKVCNKIIEIDQRSIYTYEGNYDYYLRRRAERIEALEGELAKVRNTLRREQEWMSRQPQARAGKAKYRIDEFYRLKEKSRADYTERNVTLDVKSSYMGSKIFEAKGINKRFGDKIILKDFSYTFARYEKVGIIGPNGVGKSTFIKMLQGIITPDSGTWDVGETVRFGYYSQDGIEFNENKKVIDAVTEIAEDISLNGGEVRFTPMQYLTRFLFTPADRQKYIHTLSGGERCRLHLATVLMRSPNFLILDEPTNDLDIVTLGLLEEYLHDFKGCLIVVSHDRFFLDNVVDHLFILKGNGEVKDFPGTYTEYRQYERQAAATIQSAYLDKSVNDNKAKKQRTAPERVKMTYKEQREFEALTSELEELSAEKESLDSLFASGQTIPDIEAKSARYTELLGIIDEKEMRWLELSEKE
ncbi:MAG: ABC-F family ATP-binding cassette domain-containing protein [Muribaculaceae bacterium]|nr:ABC-F family ATP-binding cassette domain-containing protein [Muribaculaceae bacterium]